MKKSALLRRIAAAVLAAAIFVPHAAAAADGEETRAPAAIRSFADAGFTDIGDSDWFYPYVRTAYEYGLTDGKAGDIFAPGDSLTVAEAVKLAVTVHMSYYDKELAFEPGVPWYGAYTDSAVRWGITEPMSSYTAPATRALLAELIFNALPADARAPINTVGDYHIPDVVPNERYGPAVYALYRAGILSGASEYGLFDPDGYVTRAQSAVIAARSVKPEYRARLSLPERLSASEIYSLHSGAVIQLDIYDAIDTHIRTGGAFFISSSGLAMTNLHVIEYGERIVATLADGSEREVTGTVMSDAQNDIAILRVEGGGYKYLKIAESSLLKAGAPIYVISGPLGLAGTISEGVVSAPLRTVDEQDFIQFTACISFGSGGSPLIDSHGFAVGIASSSFSGGQGVNLATPLDHTIVE
jgi:hypothetical protein